MAGVVLLAEGLVLEQTQPRPAPNERNKPWIELWAIHVGIRLGWNEAIAAIKSHVQDAGCVPGGVDAPGVECHGALNSCPLLGGKADIG